MTIKDRAKNLLKLADHIRTVPQKQLKMRKYIEMKRMSGYYAPSDVAKLKWECGTSACALGHAVTIFPDKATNSISWNDFLEKVFGPDEDGSMFIRCFYAHLSSKKSEVISRLEREAKITEQ